MYINDSPVVWASPLAKQTKKRKNRISPLACLAQEGDQQSMRDSRQGSNAAAPGSTTPGACQSSLRRAPTSAARPGQRPPQLSS